MNAVYEKTQKTTHYGNEPTPFPTSLPVFRMFPYHIIRAIPAGSFGKPERVRSREEKRCSHSA